jgi:hypothetical protein
MRNRPTSYLLPSLAGCGATCTVTRGLVRQTSLTDWGVYLRAQVMDEQGQVLALTNPIFMPEQGSPSP